MSAALSIPPTLPISDPAAVIPQIGVDAPAGFSRELVLAATIPGRPFPWPRARDAGDGHYVNPPEYQHWLERVGVPAIRNAWLRPPAPGSLRRVNPGRIANELLMISCLFYFARPQRRPSAVPKWMWDSDVCFVAGASDHDNHLKAVQDAVGRAGVWLDDNLVTGTPDNWKLYLPRSPGPRDVERSEVVVHRWVSALSSPLDNSGASATPSRQVHPGPRGGA